jgi:hypothetical protein
VNKGRRGKGHLHHALRKYGEDAFQILSVIPYPTELEAFEGECATITWLLDCGLTLYNKSAGGYGGQTKVEEAETRLRKSRAQKIINADPEVRRKKSIGQLGRVKSLETREKLSKVKSIPVRQLTLEGVEIALYPSALAAEVATGVKRAKICLVCKRTRNKSGGFRWEYV